MSRRTPKANYWQDAPMPRTQLVLIPTTLQEMIRRVRSSRVIEYQLKHSIDFMWLTSGRTIDHTTLSEFRRKHTQELKDIFKQMVKLAIDLKVANLAELCIDGTRVLADSAYTNAADFSVGV